MMSKADTQEDASFAKLENQIAIIKYVILFTNVLQWALGAAIFALCLWLRFEEGIQEWLQKLDSEQFYIGVYVLIVASLIVMIVSFIGCISALQESTMALLVYIGTQVLSFIFGLSGSAVLLDNSARDSHFQPRIRESMRRLIMNAHHDQSRQTLAMIQENVGCCGADGATDYLSLQQPLPSQCRDTVTGNPFFHGCVDELTWFFEEKCGWIAGLAMAICMINVLSIVLSTVLIQALKKEEEASDSYRR